MTTDEQDDESTDDHRRGRPVDGDGDGDGYGGGDGDGGADAAWQPILDRDATALEALLMEHLDVLTAFLRYHIPRPLATKESVSDLTQSVVGDVLPKIGEASFEDRDAFRRWLFTCALNKIRERGRHWTADRRDQDRSTPMHDVGEDGFEAEATAPSEAARRLEASEALHDALMMLSEDERVVVILVRLAGHTHEVAAGVIGRSPGASRKLLSRAMSRLSGLLPDV